MTTALTITVEDRPDDAVVVATGEIDMSNAGTFAAALHRAADRLGGGPFTVDLTGVGYLDSAGLAALLPHADHVRLVAGPLLAPVLAIYGLEELTTIADS